ncbi:MAG: hypothetical protein HQ559_00815 [Lentisphaerae bacterium]|nr:hypothetical protein [Lentisphaerota bacterium]
MKDRDTMDHVGTQDHAPVRKTWSAPQLTTLDAGGGTGSEPGFGADGGFCSNSFTFSCNACFNIVEETS